MILGLNLDSIFGSGSSKPAGLQRICMILGLNLDSVFGSWSFKKKDETNVYKCLQKPLIHDAKLILEILLFGSWSSAWFWVFLHDFGTKSTFSFGSLSSKPPGLQRICMILGVNLDSVFGSWSFKKKDETKSTKASNSRCKINFGNLTFRILILQTTRFWLFLHDFWD